jgi:uncharacterized protein involved in exopolysaccharide biosynthesis
MSVGLPDGLRETEYTLADYWTAVYRRKWIILLVTVVAAVSAGLTSAWLPKQYEAQSVFYVPRDVESSIGIGRELLGARLPTGMMDHARAYASILQHPDAWEAVRARFPQKSKARFARDLDIVATREGVIRVFCRDQDPVLAADIANAMVEYFNEFHSTMIKQDLDASLSKIDEEIRRTDQQLAEAIRVKQAFQEEHGIGSMPNNLVQVEEERTSFTSRLLTARVRLASIDEEMRSLDRQIEEESNRYIRGQLLETKEGAFHAQLRERRALLEVDRGGTQAEIAGLEKAINTIGATIKTLPERMTELSKFDDDIQTYRQIRDNYEKTRDDLRTSSLELRRAALVISKATPPTTASFPRTGLNVLVAMLAGLIVGTIYALLLEEFRRRRLSEHMQELELERWRSTQADESPRTAG